MTQEMPAFHEMKRHALRNRADNVCSPPRHQTRSLTLLLPSALNCRQHRRKVARPSSIWNERHSETRSARVSLNPQSIIRMSHRHPVKPLILRTKTPAPIEPNKPASELPCPLHRSIVQGSGFC